MADATPADATPADPSIPPLILHHIRLTQHQDSRHLLDIRPSPGKGLGLFANAPIPRGTRIIAERALLPLPIESCHISDIMAAFSALTPSEKEFFLSLHSSPASTARFAQEWNKYWFDLPPLTRQVIEICRTNGSDGGVFFASSRLNHSCVPNVFTELNWETMVRTFHTIRSVEKGEELTVSYTEVPEVVKAERQAHLKEFGFTCECPACEDSAEGRRLEGVFQRLCELKQEMEEALRKEAWERVEERARWMVKRMESEGFLGAPLCQSFDCLVSASCERGDRKKALYWAERRLVMYGILIGEDNPEWKEVALEAERLKALYRHSFRRVSIVSSRHT